MPIDRFFAGEFVLRHFRGLAQRNNSPERLDIDSYAKLSIEMTDSV